MKGRKLLRNITEPRYQCLRELSLRKEFVAWVREALEGDTPFVALECGHTCQILSYGFMLGTGVAPWILAWVHMYTVILGLVSRALTKRLYFEEGEIKYFISLRRESVEV